MGEVVARDARPIASIVLCAGKGKRMQAPRTPKVCFPVAGRSAIARMLDHLTGLEFSPNIVVVGHLAGMVVEEVGPRFPETLFAFQAELRGTGHAAKQGAAVLRRLGFDGGVLVIAGDKVIERRTLEKLIRTFHEERADLALVVAPKYRWPDAGRIATDDDGRILRIVERADLQRAEEENRTFEVDGKALTARELDDRVVWINQAMRVVRTRVLPLPAPASTSACTAGCVTASRCRSFSPSIIRRNDADDGKIVRDRRCRFAGRAGTRRADRPGAVRCWRWRIPRAQ